jgi:two-component system response regulator AtoC
MSIPSDVEKKVQTLREQLASARTPDERLKLSLQLGEELWLSVPGEARPFLEQVLRDTPALGKHRTFARAASMLAEMSRRAGDLDASREYAEQVFKAARETADPRVEVSGLNLIGGLHQERGQYEQARQCYERCLALSEEADYHEGRQSALNQLASLFGLQGQPQKALECYQRCLELDEQTGNDFGRVLGLYNIGWTLEQMGRWEEAAQSFYRAVALSEQHGFRDLRLAATNGLGELFLKRNKLEEAAAMFTTVIEAERREPGDQKQMRDALMNLGRAQFRSGNLAAAEATYAEAAQSGLTAGDRRMLAVVSWQRAELALTRGQPDAAEGLLAQAGQLATDLHLRREHGEILRVRGRLCAEQGNIAGAQDSFDEAETVFTDMNDGYGLAQTQLQHGRFLTDQNRWQEAAPMLEAAARAFRRLSVVAESEEANRLLFLLEMRSDREAAVLDGLTGLAATGLDPVGFTERSLELLTNGLGFESAALLVDGRPLLMRGRPDPAALARAGRRTSLTSTATMLVLPVALGDKLLGTVVLERPRPDERRPSVALLEVVRRLLAPVLARLAELPLRAETPGAIIPGLQYRGLVGASAAMLKNLSIVSQVASTPVPVLVRGESGTGKELIAWALHESGARRDRPFVAVNCAAVPEALLEAEFFGIEKGTATGVSKHKGKFEAAHEGTVFLDEVGDMSPALQAKLLRVLQEKTFERVGGEKPIAVDVRVVAATNMNLDELVGQGRFRKDLLYRLNAVEILLPPLRERREDIPALVQYFIVRSNHEFGRNVLRADDGAMALFLGYQWPGNIRQLQHVVERAVVLARKQTLETNDLPLELTQLAARNARTREPVPKARRQAVSEAERTMVLECLQDTEGNVTKAAELAGYSRVQFHRLMRKHGISRNGK